MKKAAAILISIVFYTGVFMLFFLFSKGNDIRWFLFGFPLVAAAYFVIASHLFFRHLNLNRWHLWLSMNLIGGPCGWLILLACFPALLFNGFILFLMGWVTGVLAVVWAVVGLGFFCVKGLKRRNASACFRKTGVWTAKVKALAHKGSILLLILAATSLFLGIRNLSSVRPAADYEDKGVHTFVPYDILPIQVHDTGTHGYRRNKSTKIVYKVYYRTVDGTGYRWSAEGGTVRTLAEQLYGQGSVERRVLFIPAEDAYLAIDADETAESYASKQKMTYLVISGVSFLYLSVWIVVAMIRRTKRLAAEQEKF